MKKEGKKFEIQTLNVEFIVGFKFWVCYKNDQTNRFFLS